MVGIAMSVIIRFIILTTTAEIIQATFAISITINITNFLRNWTSGFPS
uniref:Uncharacterized protein n=1 Tax=Brugia malayi TaxID=6279 RepID=A8Q7B2_BRUMA